MYPKHRLAWLFYMTLIALFLLSTHPVSANNAGVIADFPASDVRWLTAEDWTKSGHPRADFARQADGNWYAVNFGYELDYQIHASQAAAIDTLIADIIALPVIEGPLASEPEDVHTWSIDPDYTPPDACFSLITSGHEYRSFCIFRTKADVLWAYVYDSAFHFNTYRLSSDDLVMSDLNALPGA